MICNKCKAEVTLNYCPNCGNPAKLPRIDRNYVMKEIGSVLNFDKGILYTIRELLIKPGQSIIGFIKNDRNRLVKPIVFLIITSLIYTLTQQFLRFEDGYVNAGGFGESAISKIFVWIQMNYGYANIIMGMFIAMWIRVFFRKYNFNFFEVIILLCFTMGIGMLIYSVFGAIESLTELKILHLGGIFGITYTSWAIGQFFDKSKMVNYIKGFLAYILGMITFFLGAIVLGMGVDWFYRI